MHNIFFVLQVVIITIGIPAALAAIYIKLELVKRNIDITWLHVSLSELLKYYRLSKLEKNIGTRRQMKIVFGLSMGVYFVLIVFIICFISLFILN